ncbi:TolC family protein [Microbulbifer sp. MLAF003]|uniref:TolC family protein n=1 Tax=Microbulbifer TaxID=48073 RepID=UPI00036F5E79|nr:MULTISPECIES: TolC family protein [Microbulbifer]WHI49431.1 TolC family protein [Microbulbifer sp. MLAF003]
MFKGGFAIWIFFGAAWSSAPEPVLPLNEAVQTAIRTNLRVQGAALEVDEAGDMVEALKTRRYPRLQLDAAVEHNLTTQNYTFPQGSLVPDSEIGPIPPVNVEITSEEGTTELVSLGVRQPLTRLYTIALEICEGYVSTEMAAQKVRWTQQDVAYLVKLQYFEVGKILGDLQAIDESILFLSSLSDLVKNYVDQQVALEYELLDVRARLAQRELERQRRVDEMITAKERLNALLGRNVETPFSIEHLSVPPPALFDMGESLQLAFEQRADFIESQLAIEKAEYSYDIKKSEYIPDIDIQFRYLKLYNVRLIPDAEAYVSLDMRWEFYDWGRKRDELASRASKIAGAEVQMAEVRNRIEIEVRESLRKLRTAQESVKVARDLQAAYREKVRVMINRYREQTALLTDVLEAETQLDRANSDYNGAVLSVWGALAEYEKALGEV